MAWWNDLSRREQALIGVLGAVAALFLVLQFVVAPIFDWRDRAGARAAQAQDGFALVATAAAQGASSGEATAPQNQAPLRQAVTQSASTAQIDLLRIGAVVNNQIEVQPEDIDGDTLFRWLSALQRQYGVSVAFADIARGENGLVKAQVLVFERAQ
ncbi:MAG: type II secretion system protein GspM [Hyphococcus sp.]